MNKCNQKTRKSPCRIVGFPETWIEEKLPPVTKVGRQDKNWAVRFGARCFALIPTFLQRTYGNSARLNILEDRPGSGRLFSMRQLVQKQDNNRHP